MNFKIKEISNDLNIDEIYRLWKDEKDTILLDSSKEDSQYSNYSFIGINKFLKFTSLGNMCFIDDEKIEGEPFKILDELIKEYKFDSDVDIPFISGAIGYLSYDIGRVLEDLPNNTENDIDILDSYFLFFDNLIIKDLKKNKTYITALGILDDPEKSINNIELKIKSINKKEEKYLYNDSLNKFKPNFTKDEYIKALRKIKNYILEGHIYIVNMTQRFECISKEDSFKIYSKLREINKAPFSCYMNLEDIQVISSSPERFLNIVNRKVETRPIKGTRPRGKDAIEDNKNKVELLNSEKDKSELLMVVDLERNDLSKVCKINSVKVTELFKLEEYDTVFHLVSTIIGELDDGETAVNCIKNCFPGGSITGTPKIRAMEIIEELEKIRRGLYTGCIGYFDFRGNCDFSIVIRTIIKKDDKAYFGVGGGITIESDEEMEYQETLDKAKALMRVL
ncbi:aminodeoxychorismate synthase component I [Clostridium mediterraneense]|uniref:aminodeoxychorismate synthase component I n=1 Tax=Clostridium mediterraneense TaxID=1805472 RepID=UPI00082B098B|nr:aminodeoxychorismate synthase component I [Clostridium mediterraneense]